MVYARYRRLENAPLICTGQAVSRKGGPPTCYRLLLFWLRQKLDMLAVIAVRSSLFRKANRVLSAVHFNDVRSRHVFLRITPKAETLE
jgi:hypothetical protein